MSKPIYAAVLIPTSLEKTETMTDHLSLPLLECKERKIDDVEPRSEVSRCEKFSNFLMGMTIGMIFSAVGFHFLLQSFAVLTWSRNQVILFTLAWSTITGVSAYCYFAMLHYCLLKTPCNFWELLEHWFAIGVFLGFCAACTAIDVIYGLPFQSVLITLTVAVGWVAIMLVCSGTTTEKSESSKRGKSLPLPFVLV